MYNIHKGKGEGVVEVYVQRKKERRVGLERNGSHQGPTGGTGHVTFMGKRVTIEEPD